MGGSQTDGAEDSVLDQHDGDAQAPPQRLEAEGVGIIDQSTGSCTARRVRRLAWSGKTTLAREVAARLDATFLRIDTIEAAIVAAADEHGRRVESRTPEMPGHGVPTWDQVQGRDWQPFTQDRLVVDNAGDSAAGVRSILDWLAD